MGKLRLKKINIRNKEYDAQESVSSGKNTGSGIRQELISTGNVLRVPHTNCLAFTRR